MTKPWMDRLRDERGVALPLALLGLVAVSLLVTTALVTSSTELALSNAHQAGLRSVYEAEGALEEYVASRFAITGAAASARLVGSGAPVAFATEGGRSFAIRVAELRRGPLVTLADGSFTREETYSLLSAPADGRGRAVGAMLDVTRTAAPFGANVNSGAMIGSESLKLPGGSYTISGADTSACATGDSKGLTMAEGVSLDKQLKDGQVLGGVDTVDVSIADFGLYVLGGRTPTEVANHAQIKWGGLPGGQATTDWAFDGNPLLSRSSGENWGCPVGLRIACHLDPDREYFPVIAIKPPNATTEVRLDGIGQGMLIVLGDARMNAGFEFRGIVVVTGDLTVNGGTEIHGSLVALSDVTLQDASGVPVGDGGEDEASINGGSLMQFNQCSVNDAVTAVAASLIEAAPQNFPSPTTSWFELVR